MPWYRLVHIYLQVHDEAALTHKTDFNKIQSIQTAVRMLVKKLYVQRASKGNYTNFYINDSLEILKGQKWQSRHDALQEACLGSTKQYTKTQS